MIRGEKWGKVVRSEKEKNGDKKRKMGKGSRLREGKEG